MFYMSLQLQGTGRNSLEKIFKTREPPYSWLSLFLIINLSFEFFPMAFEVSLLPDCCLEHSLFDVFSPFNKNFIENIKRENQNVSTFLGMQNLIRQKLAKSRKIEFWIECIKFDKTVTKTKMTRIDPFVASPYSIIAF